MNSVTQLLIGKGVVIPCPEITWIESNINPDRIEAGSWIGPGSKISGQESLIRRGARIGTEGPAFVTDCAVGHDVVLASGSFTESVFLDGSSMGPSAQVRFGTLLDERASAAHCVGLKQTILLPYATLGSLINFCDALLAGGTGWDDHSEVGSGFIHFNFTPHGDKATPSLFGNVCDGAWLRESRVFLGGSGGVVGPVSIGFGTVLAAGSVYRKDRGPGILVYSEPLPAVARAFDPKEVRGVRARVRRNVDYMSQLAALYAFFRDARAVLVSEDALGALLNKSTLKLLAQSGQERFKQLTKLADIAGSHREGEEGRYCASLSTRLSAALSALTDFEAAANAADAQARQRVLSALRVGQTWCDAAKRLPESSVAAGKKWLGGVVESYVNNPAVAVLLSDASS